MAGVGNVAGVIGVGDLKLEVVTLRRGELVQWSYGAV